MEWCVAEVGGGEGWSGDESGERQQKCFLKSLVRVHKYLLLLSTVAWKPTSLEEFERNYLNNNKPCRCNKIYTQISEHNAIRSITYDQEQEEQ